MDQPKIERLLRVMQLLINNRHYSIEDIAAKLDISQRTVYRYIDTFRSSGFLVSESDGIYSLDKSSKQLRQISDLIYFTDEEAYILKRAIESIESSNPVMDALKNKLYSVYNFKRLADITVHKEHLNSVNLLAEAIENRNCVTIKEYRSSNSGAISDRRVEPFAFGLNLIDVVCFEPASGLNKIFKISRIGEVIVLSDQWQNESKHKKLETDVFRMMGFERHLVKLKLTMRAANLLVEEYPLSEKRMVRTDDDMFLFEDFVTSYEGVGRFVLGLCNEIEVLDTPEFVEFLKNKRSLSRF